MKLEQAQASFCLPGMSSGISQQEMFHQNQVW